MASNENKKRRRKKAKRFRRNFFTLIFIILIIYLATIITSIYGGSALSSKLRAYEFIDVPAQYVEQTFNIEKAIPAMKNILNEKAEIQIIIKENEIFIDEELVMIEDLAEKVGEDKDMKVVVVDDNAKRVTYLAVIEELEKLGVIVEEK